MKPILFTIFDISIWSYPFCFVIGFFLGLILFLKYARQAGFDPLDSLGLTIWILVFGLLGARIGYVLLFSEYYLRHMGLIWRMEEGGLFLFGGFFFSAVVTFLYARLRNLPFWPLLDMLSVGLSLGITIGIMGCLLSGSVYGKPCPSSSPFFFISLTFPEVSKGRSGTPLYPIQPLWMFLTFLLFLYLHFRVYPRKVYHGQVFLMFLILYPLIRFCVGMIEDSPQGGIGPVSDTQIVSLFLLGLAGLIRFGLYKRWKRTKQWPAIS